MTGNERRKPESNKPGLVAPGEDPQNCFRGKSGAKSVDGRSNASCCVPKVPRLRYHPMAECIAVKPDGDVKFIRAQFETKLAEPTTGFSIQVVADYHGSPLVSKDLVKRIQARCWRLTAARGLWSTLPNQEVAIFRSVVVTKLHVGSRFYRAEFGILNAGEASRLFKNNGWGHEEDTPDAIISEYHFRQKNVIPMGF